MSGSQATLERGGPSETWSGLSTESTWLGLEGLSRDSCGLGGQQAEVEREPLTFIEFLSHVRIESDPQEGGTGGPIPFDLYDYQHERAEAWASGQSEIILKPRQIGFSWLAAAYAYWVAGYHEASHVGLFSAGEVEVRKLVAKIAYIHLHLPEEYRARGSVGAQAASFAGGSTITGYPATQKAGIGTTLRLALFDEAAFHLYLRENQGAVVPALGDFGQLIIQSTADPSLGTYGHFHDFYQRSKRGETNCQVVFLPADIRPGRDAAWFAHERLKYPNDPDRFSAFYPFTDTEAFIGRTGLVYGRDDDGVLIFDETRNMRPAPAMWADCKWRVGGVDPGLQDPTGMLAVGVTKAERIHVYSLLRKQGPMSAQDMAAWFWEIEQRGHGKFNWTVCDPSAVSVPASLGQLGIPCYKANNDKPARIGLVKSLLKEGRLTFSPHLREIVEEMHGYWYVERPENGLGNSRGWDTRTSPGHHADLLDVLGYICLAIVAGLPQPVGAIGKQQWGSAAERPRRRTAEQTWR